MSTTKINRRRHDRFSLPVMYTRVQVHRIVMGRMVCLEGHAYDVSAGGLRIELDDRLDFGETVSIELKLPDCSIADERSIHLVCRAVRSNDELDDPGPVRTAMQIERFATADDRSRLLAVLGSGSLSRAA